MNLRLGFKQYKLYTYHLYSMNRTDTKIITIFVDGKIWFGDEPKLLDTLKYTKKEYVTRSMGPLEEILWCTIIYDIEEKNLNISQPDFIFED